MRMLTEDQVVHGRDLDGHGAAPSAISQRQFVVY
jgi:hypothetical protein